MKNLPEGMIPDRDNVAYYDQKKSSFILLNRKMKGIMIYLLGFIYP